MQQGSIPRVWVTQLALGSDTRSVRGGRGVGDATFVRKFVTGCSRECEVQQGEEE